MVTEMQQMTARMMRRELERRQLRVELAPSRVPEVAARGGMIRVVVERNPRWYRDFCAAYPKNRRRPRRKNKPDTKIRRGLTLRALREIEGGRCQTVYAERLIPFVDEEAERLRRQRLQARRWIAAHGANHNGNGSSPSRRPALRKLLEE